MHPFHLFLVFFMIHTVLTVSSILLQLFPTTSLHHLNTPIFSSIYLAFSTFLLYYSYVLHSLLFASLLSLHPLSLHFSWSTSFLYLIPLSRKKNIRDIWESSHSFHPVSYPPLQNHSVTSAYLLHLLLFFMYTPVLVCIHTKHLPDTFFFSPTSQ